MKDSLTILIAVIATLSCWRMIKTYIPIPKFSELLLQLHWLFPFTMVGGLIAIIFDLDRTVPVSNFTCGMDIGLACYILTNVLGSIYRLVTSANELHGKVIINTLDEDCVRCYRPRLCIKRRTCSRFRVDTISSEYVNNMPRLTHRYDGSFIPEETIFSDWDQEYAEHIAATHSQKRSHNDRR